jgi:hypothetical protein
MKLLIYIILFVVLLIYINNHSKKITKEDFLDNILDDSHKYQSVNPYDLINSDISKPLNFNNQDDFIVAHNEIPSNITGSDNWILKNSDYSDIFNGQDMGGDQISKTLDFQKPKIFLDKAMTLINNENKTSEKSLVQIHKEKNMSDVMPEIKPVFEKNLYPIEIKHDSLVYNLMGYLYNTAYRQYYLLYEAHNKQKNSNLVLREKLDNFDIKIYNYALVKIEKSNPVIKYIFGPRNKININDVVYLSQGPFQIGPLIVDHL